MIEKRNPMRLKEKFVKGELPELVFATPKPVDAVVFAPKVNWVAILFRSGVNVNEFYIILASVWVCCCCCVIRWNRRTWFKIIKSFPFNFLFKWKNVVKNLKFFWKLKRSKGDIFTCFEILPKKLGSFRTVSRHVNYHSLTTPTTKRKMLWWRQNMQESDLDR